MFWYLGLVAYINIYNANVCVVRLAKGCKVLSTASGILCSQNKHVSHVFSAL